MRCLSHKEILMIRSTLIRPIAGAIVVAAIAANVVALQEYKSGIIWPEPKIVAPGEKPGDPPADAVILFDGKDL